MNFYKVFVTYRGTNYSGWQIQTSPEGIKTVQGEINLALTKLCQSSEIRTLGSSRTDAGVHALEQVFRADIPLKLPISALEEGLNSFLPPDIRILKAEVSSEDFHPIGAAKSKEYKYYFTQEGLSPFDYDSISFYPHELDLNLMRKGLDLFLGKHDFKNFQCVGTEVPTTVREIQEIELLETILKNPWGERKVLVLRIKGDGFLKQMVRMIMGALWMAGRGKISQEQLKDAINMKTKERVGFAAPACGLYLSKIHF